MPVNESVIKDIRTGIVQQGSQTFARVVVDLGQMLGYVVSSRPDPLGTTYLIDIDRQGTPQVNVNPLHPNDLTGQIVVIDPGHGADDSGAVGINGLREKDITLSIGKKLRDVLVAAGATVHMTRETDVKPSVDARPLMAIAWHANYFLSVHCDESGPTNSHSGTTVYFHAQNAVCKDLAQLISSRVGEVSGIPALGVKSDTIRFQSGFGVLRGSPMPAVLVECGYVNDVADAAKLIDDATQQKIAQGIAAGLRDFVANQNTHQ
jgi:N-acetylmuramoyl-L-alanine amidase